MCRMFSSVGVVLHAGCNVCRKSDVLLSILDLARRKARSFAGPAIILRISLGLWLYALPHSATMTLSPFLPFISSVADCGDIHISLCRLRALPLRKTRVNLNRP